MRNFFAALSIMSGFIASIYLCTWSHIAQPVLNLCNSFYLGTVSAVLVGIAAFSCVIGLVLIGVFLFAGLLLAHVIRTF